VAEPGSEKCLAPGANFLRTLKVDGGAATQVVLFDLLGEVLCTDTTALLLADFVPDARGRPATAPQTLWATMRRPDVLVKIDLPTKPSVTPRVRQVVPLPISPADLITLSRKGLPTPLPDLIAIVSEKLGAVVIYDTGQGQVVAQVERLGDSPFSIRQLDSPDPGTARLAVTVFGSCRVAFLEVPLNKPYATSLRGRAGSCP
jgi:hypothetical protein